MNDKPQMAAGALPTEAPFSTFVQVLTLRSVTEEVTEICTIAVSTFADFDGMELPEGKLHLCYGCNETFAPGEILYFGVNARLTTDPDTIVETLSELDSTQELCSCVDDSGHTTDCLDEKTDDIQDVDIENEVDEVDLVPDEDDVEMPDCDTAYVVPETMVLIEVFKTA